MRTVPIRITLAKQVRWNRELLVEVLKEQANQCQAGSKAKRAIDDLIHDHAFMYAPRINPVCFGLGICITRH